MPLNAVHVLLTYRCTDACGHCFVYGGPHQRATFTVSRLSRLIEQLRRIKSVRWIYFEGGEPFLYYSMLVEAVAQATRLDLATAVVSNGYWITSERDLGIYLRPLVAAGLKRLQLSVDDVHHQRRVHHMSDQLLERCRGHRVTLQLLGVDIPEPNEEPLEAREGRYVSSGEIMFRGRAVETLVRDQALWDWESFDECPHELLADPMRVHIDPHGYVHICQGTIIGNIDGEPLDAILEGYEPDSHPVVGPLLRGGPAALVQEHGLKHDEGYADACHLCFAARSQLRERFPDELGPPSVYGDRQVRGRRRRGGHREPEQPRGGGGREQPGAAQDGTPGDGDLGDGSGKPPTGQKAEFT